MQSTEESVGSSGGPGTTQCRNLSSTTDSKATQPEWLPRGRPALKQQQMGCFQWNLLQQRGKQLPPVHLPPLLSLLPLGMTMISYAVSDKTCSTFFYLQQTLLSLPFEISASFWDLLPAQASSLCSPQGKLVDKQINSLFWECWNLVSSIQLSPVAQSCPTLCNPMDCNTPGFPVHHQLPEFTQTHVHQVSDAIQPSHPLSSTSPPALNLSQQQGLFKWVSSGG